MRKAIAGVWLLVLWSAADAHAQRATTRFELARDTSVNEQESARWLRPLGVAKWSSAGVSVASAAYGFRSQRRADRRYEELEIACAADPDRCADRLPGGAFADPELEAMYQGVASHDERARTALLVTQVGIATSVVLFVLDLRSRRGPRNIPYDPDRLRLVPTLDGSVELRMSLPFH